MMKRVKAAIQAFLEPNSINCKAVMMCHELEKSDNSAMIRVNRAGNITKGDSISINGNKYIVLNIAIEVVQDV